MEIDPIREWRNTPDFLHLCEDADWEVSWVEAILDSVENLHEHNPEVRKAISRESVRMLKKLI